MNKKLYYLSFFSLAFVLGIAIAVFQTFVDPSVQMLYELTMQGIQRLQFFINLSIKNILMIIALFVCIKFGIETTKKHPKRIVTYEEEDDEEEEN